MDVWQMDVPQKLILNHVGVMVNISHEHCVIKNLNLNFLSVVYYDSYVIFHYKSKYLWVPLRMLF